MQEQTVQWDASEAHLPYGDRLFYLYLLVLSAVLLAQTILLIRDFVRLRAMARGSHRDETVIREFEFLWQMCSANVRSIRQKVPLTLMLAGMLSVWDLREVALGIMESKWLGIASITGGIAGALLPVVLGLGTSAIFFFMACQFELALLRRRAKWEH